MFIVPRENRGPFYPNCVPPFQNHFRTSRSRPRNTQLLGGFLPLLLPLFALFHLVSCHHIGDYVLMINHRNLSDTYHSLQERAVPSVTPNHPRLLNHRVSSSYSICDQVRGPISEMAPSTAALSLGRS